MLYNFEDDKHYYINDRLVRALDRIKKKVHQKDMDCVLVIDGSEGSGKSVFAMQVARYLDPTFCLNDVCMNAEEFEKAVSESKHLKSIIFDEAYTGLSSRTSLSQINKLLVSKMMEMRQKNLFVLIVIPSFFMLDRYVALFRSQGLFHIYLSGGRRGYWIGFNQKNKKLLYLLGRKMMSYTKPRVYQFKGRFYGKYAIDEKEYRAKKKKALEESSKVDENLKNLRFKLQRNFLIVDFVKRNRFSSAQAEKELEAIGFKDLLSLKDRQIRRICLKSLPNP